MSSRICKTKIDARERHSIKTAQSFPTDVNCNLCSLFQRINTMSTLIRILLVVFVLALVQSTNLAQTQTGGGWSISVSVTAGNNHVRYVSVGEVQQTRLQVFGPSGTQVFDSQFKLGNLIDWPLRDQQGERVTDGSYLFMITAKDFSGQLSQKYGTAHIDQEQIYVERPDTSDLPPGQSAALESNRQGDSLSLVDRIGAVSVGSASDSSKKSNTVADSKAGDTKQDSASGPAPEVAGTGLTGQLTKWTDGPNGTLGNSIVSELGNNIGIGTSNPTAALHVKNFGSTSVLTLEEPAVNQGAVASFQRNDAISRQFLGIVPTSTSGAYDLQLGSNTLLFRDLSLATNGTSNGLVLKSITGNIGIGTSNPAAALHVKGRLNSNLITMEEPTPDQGAILNFQRSDAVSRQVLGIKPAGLQGTYDLQIGANSSLWRDLYLATGGTDSGLVLKSTTGNIGIGTNTPNARLDLVGVAQTTGLRVRAGGNAGANIADFGDINGLGPVVIDPLGNLGLGKTAGLKARLDISGPGQTTGLRVRSGGNSGVNIAEFGDTSGVGPVVVDALGNLGVGTATPLSRLDVAGNMNVSGDAVVNGNIAAKYQDVAEWVTARQQLEAGTVVVLNSTAVNEVSVSRLAYDTRVAGVVSVKPGIILGEPGDGKVMVSTTGRVLVKVDASRYAIRSGDLLVTSNKTGMAAKSVPIKIKGKVLHRPGTIIGKALQPLASGQGTILVLLSLQ